jgi:hypothetical protein
VGEPDPGDDADRAAAAEEVGLPENRPDVEDRGVAGTVGGGEREGDHGGPDRTEGRQSREGKALAEYRDQKSDEDRGETGYGVDCRATGGRGLDQAEDSGAA